MAAMGVDSREQLLQKTPRRHRATVACNSCRARRTKCIFDPGATDCTYCRQNNFACIINKDDKRKRQFSKSGIETLQRRIQVLESSLSKQSVVKSASPSLSDHNIGIHTPQQRLHGAANDGVLYADGYEYLAMAPFTAEEDPPPLPPLARETMSLLMPGFEVPCPDPDAAGRDLGQTSPLQMLSHQDFPKPDDVLWELRTRAELLLQRIPSTCQDYLMDLYWRQYNCILHIVDRAAFYRGVKNCTAGTYSVFLHLALLAMAFTFAEKSRPDMQKFLGSAREGESTLHIETRKLAKYEMESPEGLPVIQAMLILADLESGAGRDDTGWMYAGIAIRSAFHLGLNGENPKIVSEQDRCERRLVFCACFLFDRFWAVYLGRSPTIKQSDIGYAALTPIFDVDSRRPDAKAAREMQVYEGLVQLMAICGDVSTLLRSTQDLAEVDMLQMAALDRQLRTWYAKLPPVLRWTADNCRLATPSYFLLHQQYHMAVILLHQPLVQQECLKRPKQAEHPGGDSPASDETFRQLSSKVCYKHASRIAHIFEHYYQTPKKMQPFGTALLTASTAGIALVNDITTTPQQMGYESHRSLRQIQVVLNVLASMGHKYRRANQIAKSLGNVLIDRGWDFGNGASFTANNLHVLGPPLLAPFDANAQSQGARMSLQKLNPGSHARSMFGSSQTKTITEVPLTPGTSAFPFDEGAHVDGKRPPAGYDLSPTLNDWLDPENVVIDMNVFDPATQNMV